MNSQKSIPDIRFKGFSDEWVRKKLELDIKTLPFKALLAEPEIGGKYPIIQQGDTPIMGYSNKAPFMDYRRVVLFGDHTLSLYNPSMPFLIATDGIKIIKAINGNSDFSLFFLEHNKPVSEGYKRYYSILIDKYCAKPLSIQEQHQIGLFFSSLDRLITLHQSKYEKLEQLKKSMLEKMFPKNGSDTPEIRFAGFTEPWKRQKLGDLAHFNPKSELPEQFEYVDLESVVGTEMLSHRTEFRETAPSRAQRLAKQGDVFYQTVRPYQKNNYLFELSETDYVFSTGYAQMRPFFDGYFLLCLVQNDSFVRVVLENCTGTSYPAINSNDLAKIEVRAPENILEQQKIGDFFRSLDNLIILHRRKLEKLRQLKKAFLTKMFV